MKKICLNFQIHQPFRLKRYRFFNISNDHYYYDDYANESYIRRMAETSYLPANMILAEIIKEFKDKFRVSFSISGTALDQFELYAPDVLKSFRALAATGCVEFVVGTDAYSLASLVDKNEFMAQAEAHKQKIERHFGRAASKVFCNSNMVYNNAIGAMAEEMGFQGVLTEGAKHILGWKSPNYIYCSATNPRLKLLLRNYKMSDDIRFNFSVPAWSEYPLTAEKMVYWMEQLDPKEEVINISLDYSTFGDKQPASSGIFDFLRHLPKAAIKKKFTFVAPDELLQLQPVAPLSIHYPISWTDEERDLTAWRGNELQVEAFDKLYKLAERVNQTPDQKIKVDWKYLQTSDHFRFMSTKFYSTGRRTPYNPYESPYDAFINYMNVLSDFAMQLQKVEIPATEVNVTALKSELHEKDRQLKNAKLQLDKLRTSIAKAMQDDVELEYLEPVKKKKLPRKKIKPVDEEIATMSAPAKKDEKAVQEPAAKRRGRPKKEVPAPEGKRRGRPKKEAPVAGTAVATAPAVDAVAAPASLVKRGGRPKKVVPAAEAVVAPAPEVKRRGRPKKEAPVAEPAPAASSIEPPAKNRGGRPRKVVPAVEAVVAPAQEVKRRGRPKKEVSVVVTEKVVETIAEPAPVKNRGGRPRKIAPAVEAVVAPTPEVKRRGRPKKAEQVVAEVVAPISAPVTEPVVEVPVKRRGRPKKA